MKKPAYSYDVYIAASPAQVWRGLVDGELTQKWCYGTRFRSTLEKGAPYAYVGDGDFSVVDGRVVEAVPEQRLVLTWAAHWDPESEKDRASRVTWRLEAKGPSTKLSVVHDDFEGETATYRGSADAWPLMMSSLKTVLERGEPLVTA